MTLNDFKAIRFNAKLLMAKGSFGEVHKATWIGLFDEGFMEASELLNPNFTVQELSDSLERLEYKAPLQNIKNTMDTSKQNNDYDISS
nr:15537_t:CDS:2 [Entrophospora candida]